MAEKSLKERIERLEAVYEIQNLMGRHSYGVSGDKGLEMWAKHTPGTRANVPSFGCYDGYEGIKRLSDAHNAVEGDRHSTKKS